MANYKVESEKSKPQSNCEKYDDKKQIDILCFILLDSQNKLVSGNEIYKLISETQLKLKNVQNLQGAIKIINQFTIDLELKDHNKITISYLKDHGFYRIVYRNSQIIGYELAPNDSLRKLLRNGFIGVGASALIILLFVATAFFTAPFWLTAIVSGLFVGASAYLSGILYGVVNDLFASHANLPYFLLGHQPQQTSLLRTNNKVAQGIAWGVAATFVPVVIATILFAVAATITAFFVPIATFLLPLMMIAMPLIAVGAEFYARKKTNEYLKKEGASFFKGMGANYYQMLGLDYMCPTKLERASWFANSDRNMFGFTKVPIIALVVLIGLVVLSAISVFLPPLLFVSSIISIVVPAAFAATTCITLIAAGIYTHVNRNKQLDNRYRLEFNLNKAEPNLYFDEDMPYVESLVKQYGNLAPTPELNSTSDNTRTNFGTLFNSNSVSKAENILQKAENDENHESEETKSLVI